MTPMSTVTSPLLPASFAADQQVAAGRADGKANRELLDTTLGAVQRALELALLRQPFVDAVREPVAP